MEHKVNGQDVYVGSDDEMNEDVYIDKVYVPPPLFIL